MYLNFNILCLRLYTHEGHTKMQEKLDQTSPNFAQGLIAQAQFLMLSFSTGHDFFLVMADPRYTNQDSIMFKLFKLQQLTIFNVNFL